MPLYRLPVASPFLVPVGDVYNPPQRTVFVDSPNQSILEANGSFGDAPPLMGVSQESIIDTVRSDSTFENQIINDTTTQVGVPGENVVSDGLFLYAENEDGINTFTFLKLGEDYAQEVTVLLQEPLNYPPASVGDTFVPPPEIAQSVSVEDTVGTDRDTVIF